MHGDLAALRGAQDVRNGALLNVDFNPGATLTTSLHPIDAGALKAYLRAYVADFDGEPVVELFQGGQSNPTYRITAGARRYVLRRKPPGHLLPSAHAVEREFRVLSALKGSEVPVPKTYALCEDASVIGTAFYVMEYVEGRILWDPTLPGMTGEYKFAVVGILEYAGNGQWSLEEDVYNAKEAEQVLVRFLEDAAAAGHAPPAPEL